jgi:hypothetical protein
MKPISKRLRALRDRPQTPRLAVVLAAAAMVLGLGWFAWAQFARHFDTVDELTGSAAIDAVVEQIIRVESNGNPNAKNKHTTAAGTAQFIDETWLDLIHTYRSDLLRKHSEKEVLALRKETALAREMTRRFIEQNAILLRQRGFSVTAGTVYLAHFAGAAGAVAVLSAPDDADAALVLATADARGRTKRDQIVKANPFIEHFTAADLRAWANSKMNGHSLELAQTSTTDGRSR